MEAREKDQTLSAFIQNNKMQFFLLALTTLITIANLFIASLLSPLKGDIQRVEGIALEDHEKIDELIDTTNLNPVILERIQAIDTRLTRIENILYNDRR